MSREQIDTKLAKDIAKAAALLRAGELVAFPTETVYGLGADASNAAAVSNIFRVKGRPTSHPLIVHLASMAALDEWATDISPAARRLAEHFWPGPLSLILKKQPQVLLEVTGGQETVGLRVPQHAVAAALLQAFGGGIAAPSANHYTYLSPTSAADVRLELGAAVEMVLDGGACALGLESTIVDMSVGEPVILRKGMISVDAISEVLGQRVLQKIVSTTRTSGMHALHYAPRTQTELISSEKLPAFLDVLTPADLPMAFVLLSSTLPVVPGLHVVKMSANPQVYAHDLYHCLRVLDQQSFKCIVIEAVPATAAWETIQDRLMKASARR